MVERAYRELEGCGYSRTTLRTLNLVLAKAFVEQVGRTLAARKPRESDDVRPVWSLAEARRFGDHVVDDRLYPLWRLLLVSGLRRGELCGLRCGDLRPTLQGFLLEPSGHPGHGRPARADKVASKYSCTSWMATAPSPTAEATLFVDRCRTSPTANTPGRLVSRGSGGRSVAQPCPVRAVSASRPVRMNPRSSRATLSGSHSVCGVAPMRTKRASASRVSVVPVTESRIVSDSSRRSPAPFTTSVWGRTSMRSVAWISSTRYADILSARDEPRTSMVTRRAYLARCSAACPAELAAPTTNTCLPAIARASVTAAP